MIDSKRFAHHYKVDLTLAEYCVGWYPNRSMDDWDRVLTGKGGALQQQLVDELLKLTPISHL